MTIQAITGGLTGGFVAGNPNAGAFPLDSAGEIAAVLFQARKSGNISSVRWRVGAVTFAGAVDVRVETISGQFPSGTLWSANTNINATISTTGFKNSTLTSPAAVLLGDFIAVCFVRTGASTNISISGVNGGNALVSQHHFPGGATFVVSWAKLTNYLPLVLVEYDDGDILPTYPFMNQGAPMTALSFNSGTSPDEAGNVFVPEINSSVIGVQMTAIHANSATTYTVEIKNAANTVLASKTIPANICETAIGSKMFYFDAAVNVTAGATYRITVVPSTANSVTLYINALFGAGHPTHGVGDGLYYTRRTDAGAWTDTTTEVATIYPVFGGFDDGAGGGGGGGMRIVGGGLCG